MEYSIGAFVRMGLVAGIGAAAPAEAQAADWNGAWAGHWDQGDGAQILFAGNELIGVYWRGDYLAGVHADLSHGGAVVAIGWPEGAATLTRDGPTIAHLVIHESGRPEVSFVVNKDK